MNDKTQGNKGPQLTTTDNFQKFIAIEPSDEDGDLSKLSPFVIEDFFKAKIDVLTDVKRLRGGQLLVKILVLHRMSVAVECIGKVSHWKNY